MTMMIGALGDGRPPAVVEFRQERYLVVAKGLVDSAATTGKAAIVPVTRARVRGRTLIVAALAALPLAFVAGGLVLMFPFLRPDVPREIARIETSGLAVVATQIPNGAWDGYRIRLFCRRSEEKKWEQYFVAYDDPFSYWGSVKVNERASEVEFRANGFLRARLYLNERKVVVVDGSTRRSIDGPTSLVADPMRAIY